MTKCSQCGMAFASGDYDGLSSHFYYLAQQSDPGHVMWLNRNITKRKSDPETLSRLLADYFEIRNIGLKKWIKQRFIKKFYGPKPHPFVLALQHPSKATLLGYVIEHQHFLRQWVRSCSSIMAKTDRADVTLYELDNINTEFGGYGPDRPSHYELLLRMGESLGLERENVLKMEPLHDTGEAIRLWNRIAEKDHWVETMAAMHGLELIANKELRDEGASMHYFDLSIFESDEYTEATKDFLREGYEADVGHSEEALDLVAKCSDELHVTEDVQATFLRSIEAFDRYLMARLERAAQFESA